MRWKIAGITAGALANAIKKLCLNQPTEIRKKKKQNEIYGKQSKICKATTRSNE